MSGKAHYNIAPTHTVDRQGAVTGMYERSSGAGGDGCLAVCISQSKQSTHVDNIQRRPNLQCLNTHTHTHDTNSLMWSCVVEALHLFSITGHQNILRRNRSRDRLRKKSCDYQLTFPAHPFTNSRALAMVYLRPELPAA